MNEPAIKVRRIIILRESHNLKGLADVEIGQWTINGWRIIQRANEPIQIGYPTVTCRDQTGAFKYRALISIPSQLKQGIDLAILLAWNEEVKRGTDGYGASK